MATKILPEANPTAKKLIFEKLEFAWDEVDKASNRVHALGQALELSAKHGIATDAHLLEMIADTMQSLWADVDCIFTDLRDELGIKRVDYATEASHG